MAQDSGESNTKTKILALENAWDRAMESGDAGVLDGLFDNAMIYVDYDGSMQTKAEVLAQLKNTESKTQRIETQPGVVRVFGNTAVVIATYEEKGTAHGKAYTRRGRYVDTWVMKDGKWVCVVAQATLILH